MQYIGHYSFSHLYYNNVCTQWYLLRATLLIISLASERYIPRLLKYIDLYLVSRTCIRLDRASWKRRSHCWHTLLCVSWIGNRGIYRDLGRSVSVLMKCIFFNFSVHFVSLALQLLIHHHNIFFTHRALYGNFSLFLTLLETTNSTI